MVALSDDYFGAALGRPVPQGRPQPAGFPAMVGLALARAVDALLDWQDRRRARAQLAGMDEGFRKDCAISAADIEREAGAPLRDR